MSWTVNVKKQVQKNLKKVPKNIRDNLEALILDLKLTGPVRGDWQNYSKLSGGRHHCHLNYSYVAVWIEEDKELKIIEVTYVGSRENAPY
jgi:mRNA-degrading endonuclease RelE of RelBE toxin-antitoxin system